MKKSQLQFSFIKLLAPRSRVVTDVQIQLICFDEENNANIFFRSELIIMSASKPGSFTFQLPPTTVDRYAEPHLLINLLSDKKIVVSH